MVDRIRCGNCGQFAGVKYEWSGPHYGETIHCDNCEGQAYEYDPFAAALQEMSDDEIHELMTTNKEVEEQ